MKMLVKRAAAAVLAFLLIATLLPAGVASAATKKPALSATSKTITVGKTAKLTVKNKVKGSTYKWLSKNTKIARVSQKGTVRGVKVGKTSIVCKIKAGKKNYRLVCRVTVKQENLTSQTVANQKELVEALKNKKLENLTIRTDAAIVFEIPAGDYSNVALVVDAPNADVSNSGVFKSIDIKAIKSDTWKENAKGNQIKITAVGARIVVEAGASLAQVSVTQGGGKVKIEATGTIDSIVVDAPVILDLAVNGKVGEVAVKAAAVVSVEGNTTNAVPIKVSEEAKGATLASSAPVDVKAATDISLTLSKGAEGSKVETTGNTAKVEVKNDTAEAVKVVTPTGTKEVAKDTSSKVDTSTSTTTTTTTNPGYIYTSPDPLALNSILIKSSTQAAIYFNQTVPAQILLENVKVTNAAGAEQKLASVVRHSQDTQAYFVDFSNTLETGTYTVTLTVSGKRFSKTFYYDADAWIALDAAKEIVYSALDQKYTVASNAKNSPEWCRMIFESQLRQQIGADTNAMRTTLRVETRPFKFSEIYPNVEVEAGHVMVSIWVSVSYGEANFMINRFVDFECNEAPITIDAPEKVSNIDLKQSIVIKCQKDFQYACVKSGVKYADIPKSAWICEPDQMGYYEFKNLEAGATYIVYKRLTLAPEIEAASSGAITLDLEAEERVCVAEPWGYSDMNIGDVENGKTAVVSLPMVKVALYGNKPEGSACRGSLICTSEAAVNFTWKVEQNQMLITIPINTVSNSALATVGAHTLKFEYKFQCDDNKGQNATIYCQSKPVTMNIIMNVKAAAASNETPLEETNPVTQSSDPNEEGIVGNGENTTGL